MRVVKSINPKSSQHKEKFFFCFFNSVSVWDDECSLNLLWESLYDACESNHYAVHPKLIQCCMSITSPQNWKEKT